MPTTPRQVVKNWNDVLTFGKHRGRTIEQVCKLMDYVSVTQEVLVYAVPYITS